MAKTYEVVRFSMKLPQEVLETGLTLEEAQAHCNDPETSSSTCTDPDLIELTERHGPWFDGYREE